ncbi:MAG TPA: class I SAM-dependent methyltransferase [Spirochaetota bacterium]|nr:class I SAM-dependent methyltransferase [Spirochaetota bacterium]
MRYDERYFLDAYRSQYGKTYAEDRDAIRLLADARLRKILALCGRKEKRGKLSLLDIGSALGFFMESAKDAGIGRVYGVEISRYACEWCRRETGFRVANTAFEKTMFDETFDIITAWYFIEHCERPREVIQRIYALLNPGGIFAFSAPSVFGPQFLFDRRTWGENHPEDHRIDISPASAERTLKRMGFCTVRIRAAGVHPDRVLPRASPFFRPFSLIYGKLAPLLRFSDTIEVYARK